MTAPAPIPYNKTTDYRVFAGTVIALEILAITLMLTAPSVADAAGATAILVAMAYGAVSVVWHARSRRPR